MSSPAPSSEGPMPGQALSIAGIIISGVLIAVGLVVSAIATITLVNSSM